MRRLTHAQGRREPGVSLIEDLHWLDGATEAFLANYVEALAGVKGAYRLVRPVPEFTVPATVHAVLAARELG